MKIRLLSDLHEEFGAKLNHFYPAKGEDVLVLAGDISSFRNINKVLECFLAGGNQQIVYVPGNHEFYGIGINDLKILQHPRLHYLNPGIVAIEGVSFIGAPLWTDFQDDALAALSAFGHISDFGLIKKFSPQ